MSHAPHAHSVDWLFAELPGEGSRSSGPVALFGGPIVRATQSLPPVVWPEPPPKLEDATDLQAAYEWLQSEKGRLEQYTRSQFAMIEEQHQAMLAKHFGNEQTLVPWRWPWRSSTERWLAL
jgi:hypothetical protein